MTSIPANHLRGIPTIDLGGELDAVVAQLAHACTEVGFFQIVGHGVDDAVLDAAWSTVRAFFDLPLADRLAAARRDPADAYGYVPIAAESLARSLDAVGKRDAATDSGTASESITGPDQKETYNIGPVDPLDREPADAGEAWAFGDTPWPPALPALRPAWEAYFREMLALAGRLMSLFARALALPPDHFDHLIDESPSALRALNYPAQHETPPPGSIRAGAHTDYGTLTILRQDDAAGGLEVHDHRTGTWLPAPYVPGAFVVNLGDLMQRWTNDRWRSTLHRVVNPPAPAGPASRRQSMAFFHNANYHCVVECLPSCLDPTGAARHEPVIAGPHLMAKYLRATS